MLFLHHYNLICAQLSIFICNLSLSCLSSHQRHCASPLIESWSYPLRCSCFSGTYLMSLAASLPSQVLHSFQICFHESLVIFSQLSVTFVFAWHNAWFSVFAFFLCGFEQSVPVAFTSLCLSKLFYFPASLSLTFTTHCWLLPRRSFLFPHFGLRVFSCSLTPRFSPRWLLVNKAVREVQHLIAC